MLKQIYLYIHIYIYIVYIHIYTSASLRGSLGCWNCPLPCLPSPQRPDPGAFGKPIPPSHTHTLPSPAHPSATPPSPHQCRGF